MFNKILIANRGEIACRIIRTAKKLGVQTVAVYSEADAAARHVTLADEAVEIGPAPAAQSYLVIEKILDVARQTGAEAIHPGYGFLAENAAFAEACSEAGFVFIGPPVTAIRTMGSKSAAKTIMEQAGVPLVPGYHGDDQSPALLKKQAKAIGYPVLIKASAGGGGKGMRVVNVAQEFYDALQSAKREAAAAFNDDTVLIEKYLSRPRHIEIQVFSDAGGSTIHLFERDCSVQRRHQKVLEEAPAPGIDPQLREAMGAAAIAAAQAINYVGAGTVEFIVAEDGTFYFMEMNTRLQVEHPVTELITGQDLVEWQLRIAAGENLPCRQDALNINGHAMEARIYAEDPDRDFLPATGHLSHLRFPVDSHHVRVDTGVRQGDTVTVYYDPMIAKLIVWDQDRKSCLRRMAAALNDTQVVGVTTNIDFLASVISHEAFQSAEFDTGFIDRHHDDLFPDTGVMNEKILAIAALFILQQRAHAAENAARCSPDPYSPWHYTGGWRMNQYYYEQLYFHDGVDEHEIMVRYQADGISIQQGNSIFTASGELTSEGDLLAVLDGTRIHVTVVQQGNTLTILHAGSHYRLAVINKTDFAGETEVAAGSLTSPMPGKVIDVLVKEGEQVAKGTALLILEAMKMEHTITAPLGGKVSALHYSIGDMVDEGVELLVIDEV